MKSILLLLFTSFSITSFAQSNFQEISFADALRKSAAESKLILLQYESATCTQCNEVADKGLGDENVFKQLAQTFICIKIDVAHPERKEIGARYNVEKGFGTLFINQNGTLIHKFSSSTTFSAKYKEQADLALEKAGESIKINELEKEYNAGNKSPGFVEALLLKKKSLNLPTDALLDEYVSNLPADSLKAIRTLQFIARMSPLLGSKADHFLRADKASFAAAWYSMDPAARVSSNRSIISKSMAKAIADKNINYAVRTASFTKNTYDKNVAAGTKAFEANMLHYFDATNDTTNYFKKAIAYYDQYFMHLSADSIKNLDSANSKALLKNIPGDTVRNGDKMVVKKLLAYSPMAQTFTQSLYNAALNFYHKTNNPYCLSVALEWITKGLTFFETPEALDTYALLLYKLGKKEKAMEVQTKVIAIRKQRGFPTKEYEDRLQKMMNNAVLE